MVLHLLGKKSWNVYNPANIARVRRDEADARAREEAEDQRTQQEDATRRIALLRGEQPPPLPSPPPPEAVAPQEYDARPRKRRRLRGEDDTDRDIRYAREDAAAGDAAARRLVKLDDRDVELHDKDGHLQLFAAPDERKKKDAARGRDEEKRKRKDEKGEDDNPMAFANAAGYRNGMARPWYAAAASDQRDTSKGKVVVLAEVQDRDVWGNQDPRRRDREHARLAAGDPLAAMQNAQRQLKTSARDRERWKQDRAAEVEELKRAQRRRERRKSDVEDNDLEGFSLDDVGTEGREQRKRHHRRHHHRSRSRERKTKYARNER